MQKYQAGPTDVNLVMENPELYIIPECLEACKILWNKGSDTTQCSNYSENDTDYWIEIDRSCLSDENYRFVYGMINNQKNSHFDINFMTHNPCISVPKSANAVKALCELANSFELQDTNNYVSEEEYLDSYKRTNGEYIILDNGNVGRNYNQKYMCATIEEAVKANGDEALYIPEEGRIYANKHALYVHQNYLHNIENNSKTL